MSAEHRRIGILREFASLPLMIALLLVRSVEAYVPGDPWSLTASGSTNGEGNPITLTWSIVPDNTSIFGGDNSNLVSYLDGIFDPISTSWLPLFEQSFDRWSQLGGITFVRQSTDDGSLLQLSSGVLGVRGDVRLGGMFDDGPGGTLAFANLPNDGDIVFDTGETTFFSNASGNYLQLRNTLMHEIGHAFGLFHVVSTTNQLLLEPFIGTSFDGPQLDDIRGIHGLYGDALEKTNGGLGNDAFSLATSLGAITAGSNVSIGDDAASGQFVGANETDFVSIANSSDADFYSFSVSDPSTLQVTLTPWGGIFNQGVEFGEQSVFDANSRNNLSLTVLGTNGVSVLGLADNTAAGGVESLANLSLTTSGQYFVRVQGADDSVQLYDLQLSATLASSGLAGDFDDDQNVDGHDLLVWQNSFGLSGNGLAADGNGDGNVNGSDLQIWEENFGSSGSLSGILGVPEPTSGMMWSIALILKIYGSGHWRRLL